MEPQPSAASVESSKALPPAAPENSAGKAPDAVDSTVVHEPASVERVNEKGGAFKLACACGKRIVTPLKPKIPVGRCPKCGRRLKLPTDDQPATGSKPVIPSASHSETVEIALKLSESSPGEEEIGTIVIDAEEAAQIPDFAKDHHASKDAAIHTADLLRKNTVNKRQADSAGNDGIISAWPRAGRAYRLVSGMLDLTLPLLTVSCVAILGVWNVLPSQSMHPLVLFTAFFSMGLINDVLLQMLGGSFGKRLVVLTLRDLNGFEPSIPRLFVRALIKWTLIPGWCIGLIDPEGRCLHDWVCGTIVLKARSR